MFENVAVLFPVGRIPRTTEFANADEELHVEAVIFARIFVNIHRIVHLVKNFVQLFFAHAYIRFRADDFKFAH